MLLKACLNGARRPGEHPLLPVTASQLARDVAAVMMAGADAVHLHVKDADGVDTLDGDALAQVLTEVRGRSAGVAVGVTTGAWAQPDPQARVAAIRGWTVLPEFASVNWHEDGAHDVAAALLDRGIAVEAGLWHADAAAAWTDSPLRERCLRVLLELPDGLDAAATNVQATQLLEQVCGASGERMPVLLHGEGSSTWPALRYAVTWSLATRIGLEDTLVLPDGSPAPDNAALVRVARLLHEDAAGGAVPGDDG